MNLHTILPPIIMLLAVTQLVFAYCSRRRIWADWAKHVAIAICGAFLTWGVLALVLDRLYSSMPRDTWAALDHIKGLLGGMGVGMVCTILIARPYQRVNPEAPSTT